MKLKIATIVGKVVASSKKEENVKEIVEDLLKLNLIGGGCDSKRDMQVEILLIL